MNNEDDEELCGSCGHAMKYHTDCGCIGAFPNGTKGVHPQEVFYGECHCSVRSDRKVPTEYSGES